ncbi:hypothetical protein LCGC14_2503600 [marine sediment metagenome]|uniref:Uncharacterized protein n=1 Tax=marine sediment metagenome TaxID=412755 RepID=A0A0F9DCW4_9ZZZZ
MKTIIAILLIVTLLLVGCEVASEDKLLCQNNCLDNGMIYEDIGTKMNNDIICHCYTVIEPGDKK